MHSLKSFVVAVIALVASVAHAQVGVDGLLGAEWSSVTPTNVPLGPASGSFVTNTELATYDVYSRADATHFYGLIVSKPADATQFAAVSAVQFANVYFDTNPSTGSDLGFELSNNRAFKPGVSGYYNDSDLFGLVWAKTDPGVYTSGATFGFEFAVPWAYLLNDPQGVGFPSVSVGSPVMWRSVQAYGYNFVNGNTINPGVGFGTFQAVPEPATMTILALAAALKRRKAKKTQA
ncbi:MAG: hypothetical protein LCH41_12735 [Armatimonadetes bacterium]|nr:hypothetical protein [Armatimonadota bacterium]